MNFKKAFITTSVAVSIFVSAVPVLAHVVVKPNEVGVGAFQTFTTGVPNEKDNPTVALRLVIPEGLNHVSPNVKPGWTIDIKKTGEGEDAKITEISWTGGSIPAGQRDDFLFSAQVPVKETTLQWKAYQTYENGEVVSWDQKPGDKNDHKTTPYSQTKIVNDLKAATANEASLKKETSESKLAFILSVVAIVMASSAFLMQRKGKK